YATPLDTGKISQIDSTAQNRPKFEQKGQEPFTGAKMVYNLKTRKGRIIRGKSHSTDAYYHGSNIMKTDKETFYIADGKYTTCDLDTPHYSFRSQKMKIIDKDKIVAKPLILHIQNIPIIGVPFAVFPKKGGTRHSGWIMPSYGDNKTRGPHIRGLGYFWAINDYTDFKVTTDFFTNRGIRLNLQTRYKLRYILNGNISGFYDNSFLAEDYKSREWGINITHSQDFSPSMHLNINGRYVSQDDYYQKNAIELEDRLNQQMISNASFRKNWRNKPFSFSINARQTINLQANNITANPPASSQHINYISRQLPNVSFNHSSKPLFPQEENANKMRWYNKIYFSYNSSFNNKQKIYYETINPNTNPDSLYWKKFDEKNYAWTHNLSLNSSQKIFSYFSVNQNFSLSEDWVFEYEKPITDANGNWIIENNSPVTEKVHGFLPRHTGNASVNLQTKLYGLFPISLGALNSIRHIMTPSTGISYRPDFTNDIYGWDPGYIMTGQDSSGNIYNYDPFSSTMVGSTPSYESRSLNFSLSNVFQAKVAGEDEDKKIDLFNLNLSSGYNFVADSLKLSPLNSSIRTNLGQKLNININMRHDFYAHENNRRINKWNNDIYGIPIPELRSVSASTGFSLKGHRFSKKEVREAANASDSTATKSPTEDETTESQQGQQLWSANFNLRYSKSRVNSGFNETFFTSMNMDLNISENWSIGYRASFDLIEKKLENHTINIQRDLHCWQMSFNWTPSGYGSQYHFIINIKSSALRDLKYEERGGRRRTAIF
ncbi:MAG: hypothetical protein K9M80_08065, partial [Candidatus Marinimicrobia bacterium]|nr:hypothetical protein [Candidatus Neomarinimicrobiota bacterium]